MKPGQPKDKFFTGLIIVLFFAGLIAAIVEEMKNKNMLEEQNIVPGIYEHSNGEKLEVFTIAQHTKTKVDLVIYCKVDSDDKPLARPLKEFLKKVKLIKSYE